MKPWAEPIKGVGEGQRDDKLKLVTSLTDICIGERVGGVINILVY